MQFDKMVCERRDEMRKFLKSVSVMKLMKHVYTHCTFHVLTFTTGFLFCVIFPGICFNGVPEY